ncbi:MAG: tetratricopeptide repeat protein, partial [Verrucomicrobiota bacterium]
MSTVSPDSPDTPRPIGEIAQGPSAFEQFLDRNQKNLLALTILLALAVAAWVIYHGVANSKEHSAGAELTKAEDQASLSSLVKNHAGTAAAGSAEVLLADRQWSEGDKAAAIATLKAFIAANSKHPARPTAQASLGSKLQAQGQAAEASKVFQQIVEDPTARFMVPYALLALGDISKAAGDTSAAEKSYQKAKTEFPDNSFSNIINKRLSLLKA